MTDEDVVFSTAETELMTLRMQVEYWRLEAQRLATLLADLEQAERQRNNFERNAALTDWDAQ